MFSSFASCNFARIFFCRARAYIRSEGSDYFYREHTRWEPKRTTLLCLYVPSNAHISRVSELFISLLPRFFVMFFFESLFCFVSRLFWQRYSFSASHLFLIIDVRSLLGSSSQKNASPGRTCLLSLYYFYFRFAIPARLLACSPELAV